MKVHIIPVAVSQSQVITAIAAVAIAFIAVKRATSQTTGTLTPPNRPIVVAFVLGQGATVIDFSGPWEVFQDVMLTSSNKSIRSMEEMMADPHHQHPFNLYTVAESKNPINASGGMKIVPKYTFAEAPTPDVIVIPAGQSTSSTIEWLKKVSPQADVTFSVCTGAGVLAQTGFLDGQKATTHHWFVDDLGKRFPKVQFERGVRYVENGKYSSAAGLTSGIDLALRVVERYFGHEVALSTAHYMEYESNRWKN